MILTDLVAESPDVKLEELRERMKKQARVEVSVPTICRALRSLGLSRKKTIRAAAGRSGRTGQVRRTAKNAVR
jgi:transposase